ncbi:MAG: hypothetical protein IJ769_10240, partial [Clostridia bacterium]|nr:hypothetical protein [Clostridia bacterium]
NYDCYFRSDRNGLQRLVGAALRRPPMGSLTAGISKGERGTGFFGGLTPKTPETSRLRTSRAGSSFQGFCSQAAASVENSE